METVILMEFASDAAGVRSGLLDRVAPLSLRGEARLSFVGTERDEGGRPASEVIAVGFKSAAKARLAATAWRADPAFSSGVEMRLMRIEPIWSIEPLAVMFP